MIEASTSTQQVVSLSTAESEFYGIVRGAASGIQLREAFMQFGFSVRLRVLSHSSAARAATARTGIGRVQHVEARYLWVQDRVRKKQFSVGSIDTSHKTPDLGTKFNCGERLKELVRMMPIVIGEFEPTELPKKLIGALFLASQVTQVQGNDEEMRGGNTPLPAAEVGCAGLSLQVRQRYADDDHDSPRSGL